MISPSPHYRIEDVLIRLQGRSTLTISDEKVFARQRGIVGFYQFAIKVEAANAAGLKVSSKLLRLATVYGRRSQ